MPVIYDRALSPGEIQSRFAQQGLQPPTLGGVLACWPLSEERGLDVSDISPSGRSGRIVNHATWQIGGPSFDAALPRFGTTTPAKTLRVATAYGLLRTTCSIAAGRSPRHIPCPRAPARASGSPGCATQRTPARPITMSPSSCGSPTVSGGPPSCWCVRPTPGWRTTQNRFSERSTKTDPSSRRRTPARQEGMTSVAWTSRNSQATSVIRISGPVTIAAYSCQTRRPTRMSHTSPTTTAI